MGWTRCGPTIRRDDASLTLSMRKLIDINNRQALKRPE